MHRIHRYHWPQIRYKLTSPSIRLPAFVRKRRSFSFFFLSWAAVWGKMCEKGHLAHLRGMWLTHDLLRNCRLEASKRGGVSERTMRCGQQGRKGRRGANICACFRSMVDKSESFVPILCLLLTHHHCWRCSAGRQRKQDRHRPSTSPSSRASEPL